MVRRRGTPSQNWRTFLRNHAEGIAAIDMFVVVSTSFRLLYVMIILAHDRRNIVSTAITEHPTAAWLSRQVTEAFPWDTAPRYLLRDRDASYGSAFRSRVEAMGITEVITAATLTLAERLRGARDRFDPSRMSRPPHDLQRASFAPRPVLVRRLLPTHPHASIAREGLPRLSPDSVSRRRESRRDPKSRRLASSVRTTGRLIRPRFLLINGCAAPACQDRCIGRFFDLDQGGPRAVQITSRLTEAHRFDGYSRYSIQVRFRLNFQ